MQLLDIKKVLVWYWENTSFFAKLSTSSVITVVCLLYSCITNPGGAINHFMIIFIDVIYGFFPSTPVEFTIGYMLKQFSNSFPNIGWGIVYEVFSGMSVMFGLWCVVTLYKLMPFI